ncbi:MAG TPA: DNA methyltransferase, partial [Actinomycetota bacterium]|nr:DNA methyltransferase [Actinomycetota bacterium]
DEDTITNHGAQKPAALYERAFINHGRGGDWIYDPFVGSGTALIAAERTGRRSLVMDIDPTYCDVAVKRWEEFVGAKAERAA